MPLALGAHRGRVAQIILETAERGCLSRSTFDNPKPVEFRALIRQSGLLRVGHPRSVRFGQHALDTTTGTPDLSGSNARRWHTCRMNPAFHADAASCIGGNARACLYALLLDGEQHREPGVFPHHFQHAAA
jgi:hypothetical protein